MLRPAVSGLDVERVSVQVINSGPAGSLIGTLHASNPTSGLRYELPLRDSGGLKASTGGYPWRLDGDYETNITVTNVGTTPAVYLAIIRVGSLDYTFRAKELPIGAATTFNIRELRDNGVPDSQGRRIPRNADRGQFHWSLQDQRPGAHFAGRSEIVSESSNLSSTFSCWHCCPDSLMSEFMDLGSSTVMLADDTTWIQPTVYWADCYTNTWYAPTYTTNWSYNSSIVSLTGEYTLEALAGGESSVDAYFDGAQYELVPEYQEIAEHCESTPHYGHAYVSIQVKEPKYLSVVTDAYVSMSGFHYVRRRVYQVRDQNGAER